MTVDLAATETIHFIGIGGIGVSAVARLMVASGKRVSGSDLNRSRLTQELAREGIEVSYGHRADNLPAEADLVVYTLAVTEDNPELLSARARPVATVTYPEFLGLISAEKYTVAVSGTHGKTTTTAMLSMIGESVGMEASTIVGSLLNDRKSNFVSGRSQYLFLEACEYRRSFLHLSPQVLIITNIESDHLDYYKDLSDIQSAFQELLERVPEGGAIITDPEAENLRPVLKKARAKIIDYTKEPEPKPPQPGRHNVFNAQAALAAAKFLGVEEAAALKALSRFAGTWRRFEYKGPGPEGAMVYDDYAHHPAAVAATLKAFRQRYPAQKLIVVFQPHLYSRTKFFLDEFAQQLARADRLLILPIYAAREASDPTVSAQSLAEAVQPFNKQVETVADFKTAVDRLRQLADSQTVVVTMGAGDVYQVGEKLVR